MDTTSLDLYAEALKENGWTVRRPKLRTRRKKNYYNRNGVILWEGPSRFDGVMIVVIVTGLIKVSDNDKTGDELQVWVILRDVHPSEALRQGLDAAICWDCIHRPQSLHVPKGRVLPDRSCYVRMDPVTSVWKCYQRGNYRTLEEYPRAQALMDGRMKRVTSYGDPAAVPVQVWIDFLRDDERTGYTQQWRDNPELRTLVMASCHTEQEAIEARALGFRTFRDKEHGDPLLPGEFTCPASKEEGRRLNCESCGACNGNPNDRGASVVIDVHGATAKHFNPRLPVIA
jgi:hypothetical protein|tara:strand:- start:116 stop:973 length:858 start_codon:yes stop_codon:yes gene_type:complete